MYSESSTPKIDAIREAAIKYGEESVKHDLYCRELGKTIISGFRVFLHPDRTLVRGVPPDGEWEPEVEYRDAAFSSYDDDILNLEDVRFGVEVTVENLQDDGKFWIRLVVTLSVQGDSVDVFVGARQAVKVPLQYEDVHLRSVNETMYGELLDLFKLPVRRRSNRAETIGFKLSKAPAS